MPASLFLLCNINNGVHEKVDFTNGANSVIAICAF